MSAGIWVFSRLRAVGLILAGKPLDFRGRRDRERLWKLRCPGEPKITYHEGGRKAVA